MSLSEDDMGVYYEQFSKKMLNYLIANGSDYASACDMVQDAFIRLWKHREDFTEASAVSGFLFTVIKNLKIDRFRKDKNLLFQDDFSEEASMTVAHPEQDSADLDYLRQQLQEALAQLPENLRQTYTLFQVSQCSIKEIARLTEASESLVKVRIHRAKEKLYSLIADREDLKSYL